MGMFIIRMRPKPRIDSASTDFAQPFQFGEEGVCRAALAISASRSARCRAYSRNSTIGPGVPILFREPLGGPGPTSRPSAGGGRDDADPEGAPALPNRRPKPLCISLTGGGDKGIAKPFALSQIDHMRSIANQLYALLHPQPTLRWQPGNAACREAPSEGPR
jgi:hypothetical protein